MSMIARNRTEKTEPLEFLFFHLWHGQTEEVKNYLKNKIEAKNENLRKELIGY